jgi:peptide/nickel transport system permease protein
VISKLPKRLWIAALAVDVLLVAWLVARFASSAQPWLSENALRAPDAAHSFGFALYGQPVSELLVQGAEAVLFFGSLGVLLSIVIALFMGFYLATSPEESRAHRFLAYLLDIFGAVPGFMLSAVVLYAGGSSLGVLTIAFAVANWDASARLAWSVGRLVVGRPAYLADTALGYPSAKLFCFHYLPEVFGPLSAKFCSLLAFFVVFGSSSVVIGLVDAELFPWGALLNQGRQYFDVAPHVFWAGWLLVFLSTFLLTTLSSGIQLLFERKLPR